MKVSEKQLIMLTDIAKESLRMAGLFGGYDLPIRIQLVNDIVNQQSNTLREVDTEARLKALFNTTTMQEKVREADSIEEKLKKLAGKSKKRCKQLDYPDIYK